VHFLFCVGQTSETRNKSVTIVGGTYSPVKSSKKVQTSFGPLSAYPSRYE